MGRRHSNNSGPVGPSGADSLSETASESLSKVSSQDCKSTEHTVRTAVAGNKGVGQGNRDVSPVTNRGLPCLTDSDRGQSESAVRTGGPEGARD